MVRHLAIAPGDVFYNCFPLFHNTAQGMITWAVLRAGASMVLAERFSGSRFWADVTTGDCSLFFTMGPMVEFLLQRARAGEPGGEPGTHRLRRGFGIGFTATAAAEFRARFGVALSGGYGSTEVNLVTVHPDDDPRLDTAGTPLPEFEVAVVDDADRVLPAGEVGEIVVRPRRPFTTSLGYHGRPEDTAAARRGGWLHTGDAGRLDADGYLHFVDRLRDVIRRRGENIASADVEAAARTFPGVVDCAAVAVPSGLAVGDDDVYLAVVVAEPAAFGPAALAAHCAERLPPFAVPRYVAVWPSLPITPTGKVRKVEIRALADPSTAWDREAGGVPVMREGVR
jgi:crotonobetaine/carnitine-CoA ligase